jgi:nucleotide-binding universal stress UspA family protein
MKPIVLATDGSPTADEASALAIDLARATGATLCVAAAWQGPMMIYPYASEPEVSGVERAERRRATNAARTAIDRARQAGVEAEAFVREGDPVEIVSQTAADTGAALIVVGSHGWGALRRLVFGSVSTGLLHEAPCPVLVARHDAHAADPRTREKEEALAQP